MDLMYEPQIEPLAAKESEEPRLNWPVIRIARLLVPVLAPALKFGPARILKSERLFDSWDDFAAKKTRLILGFRHAYGDDPQLMAYLLHLVMPRAARKAGRKLAGLTHAHFVYGSEVPLWSHPFVGWLLPRVGAVPVNHANMDSKGMNRIRSLVSSGTFPLALAPEGHVTYGSERIAALETGTARFGFWAMEDLARQGRSEKVTFLPLSFHYRYGPGIEKKLARFLTRLARDAGVRETDTREDIPARLRTIASAILARLSDFYSGLTGSTVDATQAGILEAALLSAERMSGVNANAQDGSMARLYRVRNACWGRIIRKDLESVSDCVRALANRACGEAWYAMRHMETAEILTYVSLDAIPDGLPIERYVEIAINVRDVLSRAEGGTLRDRSNEFKKYPVIVPGKPLVMNDYFELWKRDKKAALAEATENMRAEYETCVEEYRREYPGLRKPR